MAMSQEQTPNILSSQLQFTPYTTYYSGFFLLRTQVAVSGQLGEIGYSQSGELTLNSRYPKLSVTFCSMFSTLESILQKYGVSHVSNIRCEEVPLFQVNFSSENKLRKFLGLQMEMQSDLASMFSAKLAPPHGIPTTVQTQLFLITPDAVKKDAQVVAVTLGNHTTCMTLWKESELFDFGALFRVYRLDPSKLLQQGEVTLKDLVNELDEVTDWFHLGVHMDVPDSKLFTIKHDNKDIVGRCKTEMLTCRMKQTSFTWSDVVRALVGIKMGTLAQKIALKYGVMVPPATEKPLLTDTASVEKVSSMDDQLVSCIHQLIQKVGVHDNELSSIDSLLDLSKKGKASAHHRLTHDKDRLVSVHTMTKRLVHERRETEKQLELMEKELQYLQFLQKQQKENEDLRAIIEAKEKEIKQLRGSLDGLMQVLGSSQVEASSLREQLHQSTIELAEKSIHVQQLERTRADLMTILESERKRVDQLLMQSAATCLGQTVKELECQLASAKEQYDFQFRDMHMKVESHQQAITQKDDEIRRLSEDVCTLEAQLQEVLQTHTREDEVEEKLHRLTVETSDLRVQLAEAEGEKLEAVRRLEGIWRKKRELEQWITELEKKGMADPQKCTAVGSGVQVAETVNVARFEVHVSDASGNPCNTTQDVTAELKSIMNDAVIKAKVVSKTPATYAVSYHPSEHGLHDLSVKVNGTPIHGSPFSVCVRHRPRLLSTPMRFIGGLNQPRRMVITTNGGMIVCEKNGVSLYTKDGQKIKTIETVRSGIKSYKLNPRGVAIHGNDYMYITDHNSHRLFKFNSNGKLVKAVGGEGENPGRFSHPEGIAISEGNKVFVCDKLNHRIQIFDTDLNLISCFGTEGSGEGEFQDPTDIAIDADGNQYVADEGNHRIQVFSQRGTFVRTFGKRGTGPGELIGPYGIHVDNDRVYVTGWGNYHISVFTTYGKFVTSFGSRGRGEEEVYYPRGITTDEDGYLYICDSGFDRIQVF